MSDEINNSIPQPDPAWDYYITYHKLLKAKAELNKLIHYISELESATDESDEFINEDLFNLTTLLDDTRMLTNNA